MIALIAAVPLETDRLRPLLGPSPGEPGGWARWSGRVGSRDLVLLHSGVGKANAAAAAALLLQREQPELVVMIGCAGSYPGSGLGVGDLAVATEEIYGDEGVEAPEGFLDLGRLGLELVEGEGGGRFPVDPDWLERSRRRLGEDLERRRVGYGPLVTVSSCSGTTERGALLARRTGGLAENMEGAAVAQICRRMGAPFLELRGISNLVEDRDLRRWNLAAGAAVAQAGLLKLLGKAP